jgi:ApaG protein
LAALRLKSGLPAGRRLSRRHFREYDARVTPLPGVFDEIEGLTVSLDRLVYQRVDILQSGGRPNSFTYYLTIKNGSEKTVSILGRKWVVAHDDQTELVVEGDRVVGEAPTLGPGEHFSYHSRHLIATRTAVVNGSLFGKDGDGVWIRVRIPRFLLEVPVTTAET